VQRAFTKKLLHMKCLTYKKRLSALCLESLELRRLKANLIVCFKILRGFTNIIPSDRVFLCGRHTVLKVTV